MAHLWTIGFQVVNFLLLLFLLHRYLWKPVRATIDQRRKEIEEAAAEAKTRARAAAESLAAEAARAGVAEQQRARLIATTTADLARDREKMIAEARAAMAAERRDGQRKLEEERSRAAKDLTEATLDMTLTLAGKLLGEVHGAAVTGAFLDRIYQQIDGLPPPELASLHAELEASPTLQVSTSPALDDLAKAAVRAHLAVYFGPAVKIDFVVDDALIAGAELRFPHARLGHSFQHTLAAARKELTARDEAGTKNPEPVSHEEVVQR